MWASQHVRRKNKSVVFQMSAQMKIHPIYKVPPESDIRAVHRFPREISARGTLKNVEHPGPGPGTVLITPHQRKFLAD